MSNTLYRPSCPGEEDELIRLWVEAYGDDPVYPAAYFQQLYRPGDAIVAERDGKLRSAIYLVEGFRLLAPGEESRNCTYLYALGTPPQERGQGYGGRTIWRSGAEGYLRGTEVVCFLPASPSLARWYGNILGTRTAFWHRAFTVTDPVPGPLIRENLTPEEYLNQREALLAQYPHAAPPLPVLRLQAHFCALGGGALCRLQLSDCSALAFFDREAEKLQLRELLCPQGDSRPLIQALLAQTGTQSAEVRSPVFWQTQLGTVEENAILVPGGFAWKPRRDAYWGVALE